MIERRLYILRHAKSSWDDPGQPDHERPLAPRGRRTLAVIAEYMSSHAVRPELVLCSAARRTRETCEGIGPSGQVMIEQPLYDASCEQLIERLRRLPAETGSVLVIGHNPAMQMLALKLAGTRGVAASGQLDEIERKFPTGALATLSLQCGWGELAAGCGELVDYMRPKALMYN
jgi:phosphohistidine phosphatase